MNKIIIILILFLLLAGGVFFYQVIKAPQSVKVNGKVTVNKKVFSVEVAKSDKDKQIGLTKYKSLRDNQGMIFAFEKSDYYNFWMKNMKFPIDIIFINNDNIVSLVENASPPKANTDPIVYKPDSPANYVLEIKSGLVKKYKIKKGDKVKIEIK